MLRSIRNHVRSPLLLAALLIIVVVFVFWGVGTNLGPGGGRVATVDGHEISAAAFNRTYNNLLESYRQQFGGQVPESQMNTAAIRQQAIRQLVQKALVQKGASELGIVISDAEVQRAVAAIPAFRKDGRFDLAVYREVLAKNRLAETSFEDGLRADLLRDRVMAAITDFAEVSDQELEQWLSFAALEIRVAWAAFAADAFRDRVQADDKALAAWFKDRKEQYRPAPQYSLSYLFFPFAAGTEGTAASEEEIRAYYGEHAQDWRTPEERHLRHILFRFGEEDSEAVRAAKKDSANRVLDLVKAGGDFSELANTYTEDPAGKGKGGDLGFMPRGRLVPEFEIVAFGLKSGETSGVVASPFGYHIIRVEEILPEKTPTLEEKRAEIGRLLTRQKARAAAFKQASAAYEAVVRAGGLVKYGEGGAAIGHTGYLAQKNVPDNLALLRDPAFARAAFALGKGELSSIVEGTEGYAIFSADDVKQVGVPPLEEIKAQVVADFTQAKSAELARKAADNALKALEKDGKWPQGVAVRTSDFIQRNTPAGELSPLVLQDAFSQIGKSRLPAEPVDAGDRLLVYQIVALRQGQLPEASQFRQGLQAQILQAKRNQMFNDWLNQVRQGSKIWVNPEMLK